MPTTPQRAEPYCSVTKILTILSQRIWQLYNNWCADTHDCTLRPIYFRKSHKGI